MLADFIALCDLGDKRFAGFATSRVHSFVTALLVSNPDRSDKLTLQRNSLQTGGTKLRLDGIIPELTLRVL